MEVPGPGQPLTPSCHPPAPGCGQQHAKVSVPVELLVAGWCDQRQWRGSEDCEQEHLLRRLHRPAGCVGEACTQGEQTLQAAALCSLSIPACVSALQAQLPLPVHHQSWSSEDRISPADKSFCRGACGLTGSRRVLWRHCSAICSKKRP